MAVRVTDTNRIPDLIGIIHRINRMRIEVGVFGSDNSFMAMIATVHEFGLVIKPKGKYLAIPAHKNAEGKSPRDFGNQLSFRKTRNGGVLVKESQGRGKNRSGAKSEIYFFLVRQVKIPERSFIRSTFDEEQTKWTRYVSQLLGKVFVGDITPNEMFERIGQRMVRDIQKKIRSIHSPAESPMTMRTKKVSNPLIDSGRMRQSVTYKVVND